MTQESRFCTNCGAPLGTGDRFCGSCGQTVKPSPPAGEMPKGSVPQPPRPPPSAQPQQPPPAPPAYSTGVPPVPATPPVPPAYPAGPVPTVVAGPATPTASDEPVVSFIEGLYRRSFLELGGDTVFIVATNRRLAFVHFTNQMVRDYLKKIYKEARAQGKGFWGATFGSGSWQDAVKARYSSVPLDTLLRDHPRNIAFELNQIRGISIKRGKVTRMVKRSGLSAGGVIRRDGHLFVDTSAGRVKFKIVATLVNDVVEGLKSAGISNVAIV